MATRSRGRRAQSGAPVSAPRAGRSTRNAGPDNEDLVVDDTQDQLMELGGGETHARDPPPRRGAPFAPSEVSIPTRPEGGSDLEGDIDEEDAEGEANGSEALADSNRMEVVDDYVDVVDEEVEETKLAVMAAGLTDAQRLSEDLWKRLQVPNYESQQHQTILKMKRRAFSAIREEYEDSQIAPFIDTRRLRLLDEQTGSQGAIFTTLRKMNLATALDNIDRILREEAVDKIGFLESLTKGVFPFLLSGDSSNRYDTKKMLEIYTQLFIAKWAADNTNRHPFSILAEVFCGVAQSDQYSELFSHGPWVSLRGRPIDAPHPGTDDVMVADRLKELVPLVKKKGRGVGSVQETYDLEDLLLDIRRIVIDSWPPEPEIFYDADEVNFEGAAAAFNARSDQQPGSAPPVQPSHELQRLARVSPTARRQTVAPFTQAQRYPSPDNGMGPSEASHAAAQSLAQLGEAPLDSADGDDDPFQTDTRSITNLPKRPAPPTSGQPRVPKRQRINDANLPPSSMPPPSTGPPQYSTQPGNVPDFEAVKAKKRALSAAARAERGEQPPQQRKPWSAADCTTLLHCIFERHASWAQIQSEDSHKFEVLRNQQAFRDKARNMKVDYLITDANLPPCFDLVALGSKEKTRLIAMGKNPNRRESDIDDNGEPINVSYISPEQQQLAEQISQTQQEVSQQAPEPRMA